MVKWNPQVCLNMSIVFCMYSCGPRGDKLLEDTESQYIYSPENYKVKVTKLNYNFVQ